METGGVVVDCCVYMRLPKAAQTARELLEWCGKFSSLMPPEIGTFSDVIKGKFVDLTCLLLSA